MFPACSCSSRSVSHVTAAVVIDVLADDSDADGDKLTVSAAAVGTKRGL
jgi:hypothetical protein